MNVILIFLITAISSVFVYYKIGGLLTTEIAIILTIVIASIEFLRIVLKKGIKRNNLKYFIFINIIALYIFINFIITGSYSIFTAIKLIVYCFIYYFMVKIIIEDLNESSLVCKIVKLYIFIVGINIIWGFIQVIIFKLFGVILDYSSQVIVLQGKVRLTGLFGEPAHLGLFCLPIVLFNKEYFKKKIIFILSVILALIISNSTTSLIIAGFIFLKLLYSISIKQKVIILVIGLVIGAGVVKNIDISRHISALSSSDTSSMARVDKWKVVYDNMSVSEKIVGIGVEANTEKYLANDFDYSKYLVYLSYYPGFGQELIYLGIIGFILMNIMYFYIFNFKFNNIFFFVTFEIVRLGVSLTFNSNIMILLVILSFCIPKYCLLYQEKEFRED